MEGEGFAEILHVVVAAFAGIVGGVDAYTEVAANHKHAYIEPEADTCAQGKVFEERLATEFATGSQGVVLEQPHIARIDEQRTVQGAEYRETVLYIGLEFKCTCAVEIILGLPRG